MLNYWRVINAGTFYKNLEKLRGTEELGLDSGLGTPDKDNNLVKGTPTKDYNTDVLAVSALHLDFSELKVAPVDVSNFAVSDWDLLKAGHAVPEVGLSDAALEALGAAGFAPGTVLGALALDLLKGGHFVAGLKAHGHLVHGLHHGAHVVHFLAKDGVDVHGLKCGAHFAWAAPADKLVKEVLAFSHCKHGGLVLLHVLLHDGVELYYHVKGGVAVPLEHHLWLAKLAKGTCKHAPALVGLPHHALLVDLAKVFA